MDKKNENNSFAIMALVAIVAVIGVISLVMIVNSGVSVSGENLAGDARYRLAYGMGAVSDGPSWHATNCETALDANGNSYQTGNYGSSSSFASSIPCSVWY